jgi:hypothetical protein
VSESEPRYIMAEPPEIKPAEKKRDWHAIRLQTLETFGVIVFCAGMAALCAGIYFGAGVLLFGAYLVYLANADSRLTK